MNKARRERLQDALDLSRFVQRIIVSVREAEEEAFDNTPENLRTAPEAQESAQTIEALRGIETLGDGYQQVLDQLAQRED